MCFNCLFDRTPLRWVRHALAVAALACASLAGAEVADRADLSMMTDFGVDEITDVVGGARDGDLAGISQSGEGNRASINQFSGSGNIAQVWQVGDNNVASVSQEGDFNVVRLWQAGDGHSATLVQTGSDNHIAAVQYGSDSVLSGTQEGSGNKVAVVLMGGSSLTFFQQGNDNTIVMDVPATVTMSITQIGNGASATISSQ
jgi:hypothetical protein